MTQTNTDMPVPATAVGFLENLVGLDVTFRLAGSTGRGTWGPYQLLAVYPEGPLPAILVKGSKEYLVPLSQITVIHEGAKPVKQPYGSADSYHSVPGMPGIQIEGPRDDDEADD
jgi:hypothetical protein